MIMIVKKNINDTQQTNQRGTEKARTRIAWSYGSVQAATTFSQPSLQGVSPYSLPHLRQNKKRMRGLNSFVSFSQENRGSVREDDPGADMTEAAETLGSVWRESPECEKTRWKMNTSKCLIQNPSSDISKRLYHILA